MTQDRGGLVHFEKLGAGIVKMSVHGKSGLDGRGDWIELILDVEDLDELELDVHKAQGRRF